MVYLCSKWILKEAKFLSFDGSVKYGIILFLKKELIDSIENIERALKQIDDQQYILSINNLYNEELWGILADYSFEFTAAKSILETNCDTTWVSGLSPELWRHYNVLPSHDK